MTLDELQQRLVKFCQAKYETQKVTVSDVHAMPGHAGFAYGFSVAAAGVKESWFLRLPPPNVNWRGTADVLRQVAVLNALDNTDIPHCSVKWSGADLEWFGSPYFVVPKLQGDVLRMGPGEWAAELSDSKLLNLGRQAMTALAKVHQIDPAQTPYLGDPIPFVDDVERWDGMYQRAADPELLSRAPQCRARLLETLPQNAPIGIFHGDFQILNLFCSFEGDLKAVIDWELTGIGSTLNDLGWMCTFSDPKAWSQQAGSSVGREFFLDPETLIGLYREAYGASLPELNWYRALAAYKFAIITGFNLSLHRRGKRVDPMWEQTRLSMTPLIDRALELLG